MKAVCIKQYKNCVRVLCVYEFNPFEILKHQSDGTPYKVYNMELDCVKRDETDFHHFNVEEFDEYFKRIEE